jgi:hypothetical protein
MKLFSFEDIGMLAKYSQIIYYACLIITAIAALVGIIMAFKNRGFVKKLLGLVVCAAVVCGLLWGSEYLRERTEETYEVYTSYKEAYENGEVQIVKGKVENFTPATKSKSFSLAGVKFKIYPMQVAEPTPGTRVILYYTYLDASVDLQLDSNSDLSTNYRPEQCVILGDNHWLEIHYIVENGENRILYIGEIDPQ